MIEVLEIFAEAQKLAPLHKRVEYFRGFHMVVDQSGGPPRWRKLYDRRRNAGVCTRCGAESGGKTRCGLCLGLKRLAYRESHPAPTPRAKGKRHIPASYYREYRAKKRAEKLASQR